jgi:GH15 family glucan-1,4-alpha-glucosidase
MPSRIEDYALIGDLQTVALVARDGSIDWLCFPRFDSGACFAALLGTAEHGRWLLTPEGKIQSARRRYRDDTLVLETTYETEHGSVTLIDCMPLRSQAPALVRDGFVQRYEHDPSVDGLPPGEGAFLACTFWLADIYALLDRQDDAQETFERLLALCNDVGLLSEEYDPHAKRLVGNFPQAFSHVGLINTAMNLARAEGPARKRR